MRRLAVPKLSPSADIDALLGTEAPDVSSSFSSQLLPLGSDRAVPPLEDIEAEKCVSTAGPKGRQALTPSKRHNISSPAKKHVGAIKSAKKSGSKKSGAEDASECEGSDGQRRIPSYFTPSPAKASRMKAADTVVNGTMGRQLFAQDAQVACQVSQDPCRASSSTKPLLSDGGVCCGSLEDQRDRSVPLANAALLERLEGHTCAERAESGGVMKGLEEVGNLPMPLGSFKEPEGTAKQEQPACVTRGGWLVETPHKNLIETHLQKVVSSEEQKLLIPSERESLIEQVVVGSATVVPKCISPLVISVPACNLSSSQNADRTPAGAVKEGVDFQNLVMPDTIQRASAEPEAGMSVSGLGSVTNALTTDTIEEMCAALLADIEDLPTTVPFDSDSQEPLEASTSPEQTDSQTKGDSLLDVIQQKDHTMSGNVGPAEADEEVQRRERLVERRKRGRMAVTDLCALEWCEMQVDFSAKVGKPAPTRVMQAGTARHVQLEREVITRVEVPVTTREDAWALKLLNTITGLRQLMHEGMTRELYIFGLLEGHWVVGVIDELRLTERDGRSAPLLCDTKTRRSLKPPSVAQKRNGMLQLMCYKLLFDQLVWESRIPADAFLSHFHLRARAPLSADVISHAATECSLHVAVLEEVLEALATECRSIPRAHDTLLLRYEWQERRTVWAEEEFDFLQTWTKERVAWHLRYWFGIRPPEVVSIEERWKCNLCAFRNACEVGKLIARTSDGAAT